MGRGHAAYGRTALAPVVSGSPPARTGEEPLVKTLHIASILALSASLTFACGDDDDTSSPGAAGSGGASAGAPSAAAGEDSGGVPSSAAGNDAGGAPSGAGGDNAGGAPPTETCEFGEYGEGGAGGAGGAEGAALEVLGTWDDEYDGSLTITRSYWGGSGIAAYDSDANVVFTQTPCDAMYNPGRFSKIVYTEPTDDAFYYCTVVFDAKTLAEAQASKASADPEDLEAGCGSSGFPWSKLTR
jgi:hypothetical protein